MIPPHGLTEPRGRYTFVVLLLLTLAGCGPRVSHEERAAPTLAQSKKTLDTLLRSGKAPFPAPAHSSVDTIIANDSLRTLRIRLSSDFAEMPFRDSTVRQVYAGVETYFAPQFQKYSLTVESDGQPLDQLIPNYFRPDSSRFDRTRMPSGPEKRPVPVVTNISSKNKPTLGLQGRNIVVWPSHGWYFSQERMRWEWQRPRLFQAVEDVIPLSFVLPYLAPMLERAGANVFIPRERDIQSNEVVVDNDTPAKEGQGIYREETPKRRRLFSDGNTPGFARGTPPYPTNFNPFAQGTWRRAATDSVGSARVRWIPAIPESGRYAVYVSYAASDSNADDATYAVHHRGGVTEFRVNQQIGGGTWIYLGQFDFAAGTHPDSGSVVLTNKSARRGAFITADAVRFGGGTGNILRNGSTSGRPRYIEAARYNLQYSGAPDTLVYDLSHGRNDYTDDYKGRPEWVNYLNGPPAGPNKNRLAPGLGIPIDISLAFHTDAGITHNDTTVGTLSIFSVEDADSANFFPNGMSRMANRDLADIVQTQIVQDLRAQEDPAWTRRQLMNAKYHEAFRPNVPAMLLELLSHQNFLDMKFVLDPEFRFKVGRAIYKGMLRFLASQYQVPYVVQPLPVSHMATVFDAEGNIVVSWKAVVDSLEPSAVPDRYVVYTRIDDGGFDNGTLVRGTNFTFKRPVAGKVYSFQVTAVNDGGESFPSEILAACKARDAKGTALVINGFTRVAGPASVETPVFAGMMNVIDRGIPDRYDLSFTGAQYDYTVASAFKSNDAPGHGASEAGQEGSVIAGNTFDYPFVHGKALLANGYSFASSSSAAVMDSMLALSSYSVIDLILGEQKLTPHAKHVADSLHGLRYAAFPVKLQKALTGYCAGRGRLFVSGAYVASDLFLSVPPDTIGQNFAAHVLHYAWDTDHAATTGIVTAAGPTFMPDARFSYNAHLSRDLYVVEAPDAINPADGSEVLLRYAENSFPAATGYCGDCRVVVFGFPFETILGDGTRSHVMAGVLGYLNQ